MEKNNELNLLECIREFHKLHNLISSGKSNYTQDHYTKYLMLRNRIEPRDVIGYLLELIDKADSLSRVAAFCKHEVINGIDWQSYSPCCDASSEYRKVKDETI